MHEIILKKNYEIEKKLSEEKRKEINRIRHELESLSEDKKNVFQKLILENPYPTIVFWFKNNMDGIARRLAKLVMARHELKDQDRFSKEISILFIYLETSLMNYNYRTFNKEEINSMLKKFEKYEYVKALEQLKKFPSNVDFTEEEIGFFNDNVSFFQKMIK